MNRPLIVFDLDGTLIDSQRDLADSANALLAEHGAPPLPVTDVAAMVGDGSRQLVARALQAARVSADIDLALDRFLSMYAGRLFTHTRPYPGVPEAVRALGSNAQMAVLTNKPARLSMELLDGFGMAPLFQWVIGGDSPFGRKPDPAGLLHLIAQAGVSPDRTAMVGDSMIDIETARAAGARVCLVKYGFGHLRRPVEVRTGDLVVSRPADLVDVLKTAWSSPA